MWGPVMLEWFERRIDPFVRDGIIRPPAALWSFYWHFLQPVWPAFAILLFMDFLAALTEVALASFVATLIDLMKAAAMPASFFCDHAGLLLWMAFIVLIARPGVMFGYMLMRNQLLSPPFQ